MNTSRIKKVLLNVLGDNFAGVFPSDKLPKVDLDLKRKKMALVANTDPTDKPGAHWIAFVWQGPVVEYFDSYGLQPTLPAFLKFLTKFDFYKHSNKQIQGPFSSVCGHYCIYYIIQRWKGFSMNDILNKFSSNLEENDNLITDWLNETFDLSTETYNIDFLVEQICHALTSSSL